MTDLLRKQLIAAGWKPGRYKGFLATARAGIEFQVGRPARADRLELRYLYHTERTNADGEVTLPLEAGLPEIQDAMTSVYLSVHENPDYSRVFGGRRRSRPAPGGTAASAADRQTELDL